MPNDMYSVSVPAFVRGLANLTHLLEKADAHVKDHKLEPSSLLGFRLYPNMLPLTTQVQIACDMATRTTARLAGADLPKFSDDEKSFEELCARIQKASQFVSLHDRRAFNGAEERSVTLPSGGTTITLTGLEYLTRFSLPNFYFHITTTHNILRHNGVAIGKKDFLGEVTS